MRLFLPLPWLGLLLWTVAHSTGVDAAEPLASRIAPPDALRADISAMTESNDGVLYFGDNGKVVRFDGAHWRDIPLPDPGPVRSLLTDRNGRIWVGGYNVPGYLQARADGNDEFVPLHCGAACGDGGRSLTDIWMMAENSQGVYLQTLHDLLLFDHDGHLLRHWGHEGRFGDILAVDEGLYAQFRGVGLKYRGDGEFEPVPGGDQFSRGRINTLQRLPDHSLLLLDTEGRLGRLLPDSSFQPIALDPAELRHLQHAILVDGHAAFPGDDGVLRMLDTSTGAMRSIRLGTLFQSDITTDRHGRIAVIDKGGATFLRWPPEGERFGPKDGLGGQINALVRNGDVLHLLGTSGDYRLPLNGPEQHLQPTLWSNGEAWDLLPLDDGMLLAESFGIRRIDAEGAHPVGPDDLYPRRLLRSRHRPEWIWVGTEHGVTLMDSDGVGFNERGRSGAGPFAIRSLVELDDGRLLAASERDGVWIVEGGETESELQSARLALPGNVSGPAWVSRLGARVLITSAGKVFAYEDDRARPFDFDGLASLLKGDEVPILVEGPSGTRWAYDVDSLFRLEPGGDWIEVTSAPHDVGGLNALEPDGEGGAWLGGSDALVHLRRPDSGPTAPAPLRVSAVSWSAQEGRSGLLPLNGFSQVPAGASSLRFDVSLREFGRGAPTEYRMRIRELSQAFPDWTTLPSLLTSALPPGRYQFEAEARRARGGRIARTVYGFEVAPAWHQRLEVRLLFGLVVFGACVSWVTRRARRRAKALAADNIALEALVRTRTLDLEAANRRLRDLADSDGLTGVGNRRFFDRALNTALQRAAKLKHPVCLVLCDVDLFKQYNDEHGHLAGDDLLRKLAQTMLRQVREDTLVARYGGEEFALIAQDCDLGRARYLAERLRDAVERDLAPNTISIGVAEWNRERDHAADDLIQHADDALYQAKDEGRNRVVCAE